MHAMWHHKWQGGGQRGASGGYQCDRRQEGHEGAKDMWWGNINMKPSQAKAKQARAGQMSHSQLWPIKRSLNVAVASGLVWTELDDLANAFGHEHTVHIHILYRYVYVYIVYMAVCYYVRPGAYSGHIGAGPYNQHQVAH